MDEMRMVREMYGEPSPPAPHLKTTIRAQLGDLARPGGRTPRPWPRCGSPRLRVGGAALATGAAGLAAVALVAQIGGAGVTSGAPPPATGAPADGERQMVLAAAHQAEMQPEGRYWHSHWRHSFAAQARGESGGYVVEERTEYFQWTGREPGDGNGFYGRDIAGQPQTESDVAAWRAAGEPSSWRIKSSGLARTVETTKQPWQRDDPRGDGGTFNVPGSGEYTFEELQDLPTETAELREWLCTPPAEFVNGPPRCSLTKLTGMSFHALAETPLPSEVRAGIMRMLATEPGIESLGAATDPLGREGTGLRTQFERPDSDSVITRDIVFDRETGQVLALRDIMAEPDPDAPDWKQPGRVLSYTAVVDSGWTDERLEPPK